MRSGRPDWAGLELGEGPPRRGVFAPDESTTWGSGVSSPSAAPVRRSCPGAGLFRQPSADGLAPGAE